MPRLLSPLISPLSPLLPLLLLLPSPSLSDDLLSTRCQSQCLSILLHKHPGEEWRQRMKHHIVNECSSDSSCISCSTPCKEEFIGVEMCKERCTQLSDPSSCEDSCHFIHRMYTEKPGECPLQSREHGVSECSASCQLDGECPETSKCCSLGCSRLCLLPPPNSSSLLPPPSHITVTERKRRRSAVVRWDMEEERGRGKKERRRKGARTPSLACLFLLQWRWGIKEDALTQWQTTLVKNKMYAILKHLLSPGRFYQFRVSTVCPEGASPFSEPSSLFKLSKEPKAPSSPTVSLIQSRLDPSQLWIYTIEWTRPPSDLPIKNYQVEWKESTDHEADTFEGRVPARLRRGNEDMEELEEVDGVEESPHHSLVLPSHQTTLDIESLHPLSVYLVEVHATVDSSNGVLHGDRGFLFIRTPFALTPHKSNFFQDGPLAEVRSELEEGKEKIIVDWKKTSICEGRRSYIVKMKKDCEEEKKGEGRVEEERITGLCSTSFDITYRCSFVFEIGRHGEVERMSIQYSPSSPPSPRPSPSLPFLLSCSTLLQSVNCSWDAIPSTSTESTIGYRISIRSHSTPSSISILPPQTTDISFEKLHGGVQYEMEVQVITSRGMGDARSTVFTFPQSPSLLSPLDSLSSSSPSSPFNILNNDAEILELPLGSVSYCPLSLVVTLLLLIPV